MPKNRHLSKKIDIIDLYLGNYTDMFTSREIARKLNINHQTALNHLQELVKDKVISSIIEGRNHKYKLNLDLFKVRILLQITKSCRALERLNNFEFKKIIESLLKFTEVLIVFGSFAKNLEKKKSDLDLVAVNTMDKDALKRKLNLFDREINIEFVTWKEFIDSYKKNTALAVEIRKNHLIYGNIHKVVEVYCS